MGNFKPTPDQSKVLLSKDKNLLVSASAGSGKTATIIEKIANLIVEENLDLQDFLIITFTEAASNDMRLRLKEKLCEKAQDSAKVANQINKLPLCDVSTIHAFCAKMIRKYFYALGVSPNFSILEENNSTFFKVAALNNVIEKYSKIEDEDFQKLSACFEGGRNMADFKQSVLSFYNFLSCLENKEDFVLNNMLCGFNENFKDNPVCDFLNEYLNSNMRFYNNQFENLLKDAQALKAEYFEELIKQILVCLSSFDKKEDFDKNHKNLFELNFPRFYSNKKLEFADEQIKEDFVSLFNDLKERVKEIKSCLLDMTEEEIKRNLKTAKGQIEKFFEIENEFESEYEKIKAKRNVLDYSDLEKFFLKLLMQEDIKKKIVSSYKYVFVDEYQDINPVQEKVLKEFLEGCHNVMVGDIKQSIYGFRNGEPNIFIEKSKNFLRDEKSNVVNLNDNFRSNPEILNFVNSVFSSVMSENFGGVNYNKTSMLNPKAEYKNANDFASVELLFINKNKEKKQDKFGSVYSALEDTTEYTSDLSDEEMQGLVVADKIFEYIGKDFYDNKNQTIRKITFSDIAILGRRNDTLKQVCGILAKRNIPVSSNIAENIFDNKEVNLLVCFLKILNNFDDDVSLATVMTSIFFNFSFDELGVIRREFFEEKTFSACVKKYCETGADEKLRSKLKNLFEFLDEIYFEYSVECSIYKILCSLQNKFDFLNYFKSLPDGINRHQMLVNFINSFKNNSYDNDLNKFLDYVESYAKDSRFSNNYKTSPDCVNVSTIHASKGLEYPIVFLVGVEKSFSAQTRMAAVLMDKEFGLGIDSFDLLGFKKSKNIAKEAIELKLVRKQRAEELRLLYVALTRAKNNLVIVGTINKEISRCKQIEDASGTTTFMPWILSGLSKIAFDGLKNNKKDFYDKQKNFCAHIKIFDEEEIFENKKQNLKNLENLTKKVKEDKDFERVLNHKFEINKVALKNSVSSLLSEYADDFVCTTDEPKKLEIFDKDFVKLDKSKLGTIYHKIMQEVDFKNPNCTQEDYLIKIIDNLNEGEEYKKNIKVSQIINCIKTIKNFDFNFCLKEQQFMSYLPYNTIFENNNIKQKVLIQGVADLVLNTNKGYVLVDYKTNNVKNTDQLVEKYSLQLKIYKICIEKALNIKISDCYIYSFCLDKLIKIY